MRNLQPVYHPVRCIHERSDLCSRRLREHSLGLKFLRSEPWLNRIQRECRESTGRLFSWVGVRSGCFGLLVEWENIWLYREDVAGEEFAP